MLRDAIAARLAVRASLVSGGHQKGHLDEDQLSAFVEGRLGELESAPFISHLVACAACRRATAELVRLQFALEGEQQPELITNQEEPGRIRRLLEDMASRVVDASDEVFAYHAPAEDLEQEEKRSETEVKSGSEHRADSSGGEANES